MRHWEPAELVAASAQHPLDFAPDTDFAYCNTNFIVLGMIAEAAAGARLEQLLHTKLLGPLGLQSTFLGSAESYGGLDLVYGLDPGGNRVDPYDLSQVRGCGSVVATPTDLAEWVYQLGSGKVLPPAIQQGLFSTESDMGPGTTAGLGILSFDSTAIGVPDRCVGHGGSLMGTESLSVYCPRFDTAIVYIQDINPTPDQSPPELDAVKAVAPILFADVPAQPPPDGGHRWPL
jgi:D-alanyl-D-alanine carboxypeptidase